MKESISFIHAADLHLDSPFKGLSHLPEQIFNEISESTFQSFQRIIELAISRKVDFIVLVGDLFDHERQSLKAQIRLRTAFQTLNKHHIEVYLSYGNHDFIHGNIHAVEYPENVHIFPEENISTFIYRKNNAISVSISGFSYENREVIGEKALEFPIRNQKTTFHIGMLHGSLYGNTEHDTYAPFRLQQLIDAQYDYWALGHIHKREKLHDNPPIIYPGNIQSRHRNESGKKGCYIVNLQKDAVHTVFHSTEQIQFLSFDIVLEEQQRLEEIDADIWSKLQGKKGRFLVSITWIAQSEYWIKEHEQGWLDDMVSSLNERLFTENNWTYIYKHHMKQMNQTSVEYNPQFIAEIEEAFSKMKIEEELRALLHHKKGRKYLQQPDESWKAEAKQVLYAALLHTKRDG